MRRVPRPIGTELRLRPAWVLIASCAFWSSAALAVDPAPRSDNGESETAPAATDLMRAGMNEYRKGNFVQARTSFLRVWELKRHPAVAASLGDVEMKLSLYRDAATHWSFYLANLPPGRDRSEADAALAECRRHVASIRVQVDQTGADVSLDGQALGKSPIDVEVWLEPGPHTLSAQSADGRSATQRIAIKAGESRAVELTLTGPTGAAASSSVASPEAPHAAVPTPSPVPSGPEQGYSSLRVPVVITGSLLTAVAVAVGVVYSAKESEASSDVERHESEVDQATTNAHLRATHGGCSSLATQPPSACSALSESVGSVVSSRNVKIAAFAGAGVLGIATVATYFLWPKSQPRSEQQADVALVPWSGPGQGVQVRLRF